MRVCPICRAEVDDFQESCEYCGYKLGITKEYSFLIQNADLLITEVNKIINDNNQKKEANQILHSIEKLTEKLTTKYSDSEEIQNIVNLLNEKKEIIQSKNKTIREKLNKRKRILSVIFSIFSEILLISILIADNFIDISLIETIVLGVLVIICGLLGLGIGAVIGAIIGIILGALLGKLLFILITTTFGKIVFFLIWQIILIVTNITTLKKNKAR